MDASNEEMSEAAKAQRAKALKELYENQGRPPFEDEKPMGVPVEGKFSDFGEVVGGNKEQGKVTWVPGQGPKLLTNEEVPVPPVLDSARARRGARVERYNLMQEKKEKQEKGLLTEEQAQEEKIPPVLNRARTRRATRVKRYQAIEKNKELEQKKQDAGQASSTSQP